MTIKTDHITIQDVEEALKIDLPGDKIHQKMLPKGRSLRIPHNQFGKVKESAVLVFLFPKNDELCFCLTRRTQNMKHHPGQISFPGGQSEEYESTAYETALREFEEEAGVDKMEVKIIGKLSELYISVSNFLIHPVIGYIDHEPEFNIDQAEVEELIVIPLKSFLYDNNLASVKIETFSGMLDVPCYKINNWVIWGATAMIIVEFTELLMLYFHRKAKHSDNGDNFPKQLKQN